MYNFKKAIALIHSDYIREAVKQVLAATPKQFFTAPSSSSGKHHPQDEISEGGLMLHTLRVVKMADHIAGLPWNWAELKKRNHLGYDVLIASAILHDCCKSGREWGDHTGKEHPMLAAQLVVEVCGKNRTTKGIANTIAAHMGYANKDRVWDENPTPIITLCQRLLHEADYLASRVDISVNVDSLL